MKHGILPGWLGRTNRYYTPFWRLLRYDVLTMILVLAAQANEQTFVLFYAISAFS